MSVSTFAIPLRRILFGLNRKRRTRTSPQHPKCCMLPLHHVLVLSGLMPFALYGNGVDGNRTHVYNYYFFNSFTSLLYKIKKEYKSMEKLVVFEPQYLPLESQYFLVLD